MKNREIFQRDPVSTVLLNDGVAAVAEAQTDQELRTLRYELEHFVCEGQYKEGMIRIISSYLGSADAAVQPAAWVSGFYGSGKSHLLKMFRHLWVDTPFQDGSTARSLAHLPVEVKDLLTELNTFGRRCGGLHAAAGTLESGGGSVRLTVLGIIFRSKGLPEALPQAQFCLWLKKNGHFDSVQKAVKAAGKDFFLELQDLYVSPLLAKALLAVDPHFAKDEKEARATLRAQFPTSANVTTADFVRLIREVVSVEGKIPATIIVLDEIQLFIGDSTQRSTEVQEVAEALCHQLDSRVLLIGAGQTALAGSLPLLQRLKGRFTLPVELSDIDVETVTRRVVLAKKADKKTDIEKCLAAHSGEIDRQLASTAICVRAEDKALIVEDYPLLPVRRRFWEHALRAVDAPGTQAQLRTQLRLVYDAVRATSDKELGTVVPADFLFEQNQPELLRTGVLLREIDETIRKLDDGKPEGRLARRLCGLIFLIRKLPRETGADIGVRPTPEMLADLLVSDLRGDESNKLRADIPNVLDKLVREGKLIKLEDGYSLQTRESSEWDREFRNRQTRLNNDLAAVNNKRSSRLNEALQTQLGGISLRHGKANEPRKIILQFGDQPPTAKGHEIPVWVRDGWGENAGTVTNDARAAGTNSPIIYVFVPKASADDLKNAIVDFESSKGTIDFKGSPTTPEGRDARDAMTTRMRESENRIGDIIRQVVDGSKVFQGGGNELLELTLIDKVRAAAQASLDRLFPKFRLADHNRWDGVINQAKAKNENALQVVDWNGKPEEHPVCAEIVASVGTGKKGRDIRGTFEDSPYGWPRDAVDAALIVLHTTGLLRATSNTGTPLAPGQLDQNKIPTTEFRVESPALDVQQKIKLRKLFQSVSLVCNPGQESAQAIPYLNRMMDLADSSGGNPPLPAPPSKTHLEDLRSMAGNEQLLAILREQDALLKQQKEWSAAAELAKRRLPAWKMLTDLLAHADGIAEVTEIKTQVDVVQQERRLLDSGDPLPPVHKSLAKVLRETVNKNAAEFARVFAEQNENLEATAHWKKISAEQRKQLLADNEIAEIPKVDIRDDEALLSCLRSCPLPVWKAKTNALHQQFANAALAAAKLLEPKIQQVRLQSHTLKTEQDVAGWLKKTEADLLAKVKKGPVVIS